jgi:amino acid adenylation domain-containing protein
MADSSAQLSYSLSPSQTRCFLEDALPAAKSGLNLKQVVCATTEEFDLPQFRKAWQTIGNRCNALGVAFRRNESQQPYQRIWPPIEIPISFEQRPEVEVADRQVFLEKWLDEDRRSLFNLAASPLTRISVFQFPDQSVTWIWTFHEILMDGRSAVLVLEDFFACYEALCSGHPVVLPERRPFSDLIAWQQERLEAREASDRSFWQQLVPDGEIDPVLSIKRTSSAPDFRQAKMAVNLDEAMETGLRRFAEESGLTLKTMVQGTWALLMSRYYRSASVTFGTIRFCRTGTIDGSEGMIGPLTNYLPVHADLSANRPVLEFLKRIQEQQLAMRDHRGGSPDVIRSSIPAAASKQLFDSCILFERQRPVDEMADRFGKGGTRIFSIRESANIPLLLSAHEEPRLKLELSYQPGLFEESEITAFVRALLTVLRRLPEMPATAIGDVELLSPADRASLVEALSGPKLDVPEDKGLHEWFEDQVKRTPDELAIVAECNLTYRELDQRASHLALRLLELGAGPDRLVAILLTRSSALLIAILGTLKSGAAYLPVDIELPPARLKIILEEADAAVVITDKVLAASLPDSTTPVVVVAADGETPPPVTAGKLPRVRGSQLAYVISTSGTTGRPKLIGVEHRHAANFLAFTTQKVLRPGDVRFVPVMEAPTFDLSVLQMFSTLALGGTLVRISDIGAIGSSPYFEKFSLVLATPALVSMILKTVGPPPSVRLFTMGGEAIPPDLLEMLGRVPKIEKIINYYGPTETTVYCTYAVLFDRHVSGTPDLRGRGRIIGRPISNTVAYIVDAFGQRIPPGAAGELLIAGAGVARGYLNAVGEAAKNFGLDPFRPDSGERVYRTGDIVRLRPDGQLEYQGRKDGQLKFNGVRMEAGDIENALQNIPGVQQAVVDIRIEAEAKQRLVAYLAVGGESLSKAEIRRALRQRLPDAMIPHHFFFLESLPTTAHGKVDRKALSLLRLDSDSSPGSTAPLTTLEKRMTVLWEKNLSRSPIGLHHDYFELGGDSLSAVNLVAMIEKQFGFQLKPSVLFDNSNIADLLRAIESPRVTPPPEMERACSFVPLQETGEGAPLIILTGGTGTTLPHYKNFARKFAPGHPVYALQYPYALLQEKSPDPLAHVAESIAGQVMEVAQDRPFLLFGHCIGGLLGWHVAAVLKKRNAPPFRLVLYAPMALKNKPYTPAGADEVKAGSRLRQLVDAYRPAWEEWRLDHGTAWWTNITFAQWMLTNFLVRRGWIRSREDRFRFVKLSYLRLIESSPLDLYPGDALVIHHHDEAGPAFESFWRSVCGGTLQLEFFPGNHRVWQTAILAILPLVHEQLKSLEVEEAVVA